MIYLPNRRKHHSSSSWANWNEKSEDTLDTTNTFVCLMENTVAGGNEIGTGLTLSETNRTLTDATSAIDGATGDPLTRKIDATSEMFTCTTAFLDTFWLDSTWTYIIKAYDITVGGGSGVIISTVGDNTGASPMLYTTVEAGNTLRFNWADDAGYPGNLDTTGSISTSGAIYIAQWSDGIDIYGGFCTTKPTALSDFATTDRVTLNRTWALTTPTWNKQHLIGSNTGAGSIFRDVQYVVVSKDCLIDNSS